MEKNLEMEDWELCKVISNIVDNAMTALEEKENQKTILLDITEVKESDIVAPLKKIVRIANEKDHKQHIENVKKKEKALKLCQEKVDKHGLVMKLIDVEYTFDNSKIVFYFTADGRVDFRELVKDLAGVFKMRIELRQIGVRDEAKMLGGIGSCGRALCCHSWLADFEPVSIKMAKVQNLSLNPTKISGICGRLMCCLKYEQDAYEDAIHRLPGVGSIVETPQGQGVITEVNLLRETVKVRLDKETETDLEIYKADEIKIIHKKHFSPSSKHDDGHEESEAFDDKE